MKKNIYVIISMMIVALLATSCESYVSKVKKINGTSLCYYSAQNPQTGGDLWGIKDLIIPDQPKVLIDAIYANLVYTDGVVLGSKTDSSKVLINKDWKMVAGKSFTAIDKETLPTSASPVYKLTDGEIYYYHPVWGGQLFGPGEIIFGKNEAFAPNGKNWTLLSTENKTLIPGEIAEAFVIRLLKNNDNFYLLKIGKTWSLYNAKGEQIKKTVTEASVNKIKKASANYKDSNKSSGTLSWITIPKEPAKY